MHVKCFWIWHRQESGDNGLHHIGKPWYEGGSPKGQNLHRKPKGDWKFLGGFSCYSPLFLAVRAGWHVWKLLNHGAKTLFKISLSPYREENSLLVSPLSAKFDYDRSRILYCQKQLLHKFGNYLARCGKFSQGKQFMNTVRGNFRQLREQKIV